MPLKFAKLLGLLLLFCWLPLSCSTSSRQADESAETAASTAAEEKAEDVPPEGDPYATLQTSEGNIVFRLRPDLAPNTVARFIELAQKNFYYGTRFHRIIPGTIIQGGDPNSRDNDPYNDGKGNSGNFLPAEFSKEPFKRGSVGLARSPGMPDSGSCQFFIVLKRMSQWDGEYTLFAEVTEGIDIVEKISESPRSKDPRLSERPTANYTIRRVTIDYH